MSDLPTWDQLDALVDTDPIGLRDVAFKLAGRLQDANNAILGSVENGPWVLIPDPSLRNLVGRHFADMGREVARDAGLGEAFAVCALRRGAGPLPAELPKET